VKKLKTIDGMRGSSLIQRLLSIGTWRCVGW